VQEHAYSVLLAEPAFSPGEAIWTVAQRLARRGLSVIPAQTRTELSAAIAGDSGIGAVLLGWDLLGSAPACDAVLDEIGELGTRPPVALLCEDAAEPAIPARAAQRADGVFWLGADSPHYVARQVERLVAEHTERLMNDFLAGLTGLRCPARLT
jgi:hypothetical protein